MLKQYCQAPNKNRPQRCVSEESKLAENRALSARPIPLLSPAREIVQAVSNIRPEIADDGQHVKGLKKLVAYINKQCINTQQAFCRARTLECT